MCIWDDRQILALLLQVPFLLVAFPAVVNNSVAYRKSTTQKTNFRTIKYKGIRQKIITIFSYSFSLVSFQEHISLQKDSKTVFHNLKNLMEKIMWGSINLNDCLVYNQVAAGKVKPHFYAKNSQYHKVILSLYNQEAGGVVLHEMTDHLCSVDEKEQRDGGSGCELCQNECQMLKSLYYPKYLLSREAQK